MNNPHVILGIESHTCDCANEPVIRQRFRPEGINFEIRNLPRVLCQEDRRTYQQKYSELLHLSHIPCHSTPLGSLIAAELTLAQRRSAAILMGCRILRVFGVCP